MRAGKGPKTAAANGKPASGKLLSASIKLVQDELLLCSPEARSLKHGSNPDDDDVKLPPVKAGKRSKTAATNGKLASGKLSSALIKLALGIGQDMGAKKVLTLMTS